MRNFKKFLALVLAMLMVSACAVSVSAYGDQAAIDATGYAKAVETLTNLGVISGDGTNFNPDDTLTRAAAAKIVAMLNTGAGITASNTAKPSFSDVPAEHWGVPYINYVSQRGIMDGIGDGKFAPDAELTIAEAIVLAVKAAGLKADVAKLNEQIGVPTFWAANWISVADTNGLTADLPKYVDYTDVCTRAMFAQVGYNIFLKVEGVRESFDIDEKSALVSEVTDKVVKLEGVNTQFAVGAFNDALKAAGIDFTAADLLNQKVTITWSAKNNIIYGIEIDTDVVTFDYKAGKIEYVKDADGKFVNNQIKILGVTYEFGVDPENVNGTPDAVGGTVAASNSKVILTKDGVDTEAGDTIAEDYIPAFYKAVAYDDDGDLDLDRVVIVSYDLVVAKADGKTSDDKFVNYKIDGVDLNKANNKEVVWTGATGGLDGETPILVNITAGDKYVIDVLEVAETVKGVFSSYSTKNSYIVVGSKYEFLANEAADVDETLIGMTVSIYTINGKYVKFASASTSSANIIVDSADVVDGKIVVKGYNAATYAAETVTLDGYYDGIYKVGVAEWNTAKDADQKDYNTTLKLGYKDSDDKFQTVVTLTEGLIITVKTIDNAKYYISESDNITATQTTGAEGKLKVEGKYLYLNGSAVKVVASDIAILVEDVTVEAGKETGKYSDVVYTVVSTFAEKQNVNYAFTEKDSKVATMFIKDGYTTVPYETDYKTLDGSSIVYVDKAAEDVEYVYGAATYTYKVIDLAKKEVVTITSDKALEVGQFYLAKDGKAGDKTTGNWISDEYEVTVAVAGIIKTVKAQPVVKTYKSTTDAYTFAQKGDAVVYDMSNTVIYNLGALYENDALKTVDFSEDAIAALAAGAAYIYASADQLIIVIK